MLILSRRIGESIIIADDVRVRVIAIHNVQVKLAIHAPREVSIHREEIQARIERERQAAGGAK